MPDRLVRCTVCGNTFQIPTPPAPPIPPPVQDSTTIVLTADKYVNALRPVFMKLIDDGQLDPADSYSGQWIGSPKGRPIRTLGGDGRKVIGIYGRRALILDAVGLVLTPAP